MPPARISLTLSRHSSISFIASGRTSGLHPVSSQSCCISFRAGSPAFALPYVGVYRSASLMSSSLVLQQVAVYLVFCGVLPRTTWTLTKLLEKKLDGNYTRMLRAIYIYIYIYIYIGIIWSS